MGPLRSGRSRPGPATFSDGLGLAPGMAVGLFGGSFDPAHQGHARVAETALRRLGLDRVVWLVSPQNPLKSARAAPLDQRIAGARRLARGPRMIVSDAENRLGLRYTIDVIAALRRRHPGVRFVWLMGADNLLQMHHWRDWRGVFHVVPVAVIARPGPVRRLFAPAARRFAANRLPVRAATLLAACDPPAWVYLNVRLRQESSTALRQSRKDGLECPPPDKARDSAGAPRPRR